MTARFLRATLLFLLCTATASSRADDLPSQIDSLVSQPSFTGARWGICIYSLTKDSLIYGRDADKLFVPASTVKLLTSAAALDSLGPDYRFETAFFADGPLDSAGTLHGDLIMRGSGDPTLRDVFDENGIPSAFQQIADSLCQKGLKRIQGRLVGDARAWPREAPCPSWEVGDFAEDWMPLTGTLSLNRNDVAADTALCVLLEAGANSTVFLGPSPTLHFLSVFHSALRDAGIHVSGEKIANSNPARPSLLYVHASAPLSEILKRMNKWSDNFYAEQVCRVLGGGTGLRGVEAIYKFVVRAGVNGDEIRLEDASGLSRKNLISPAAIVQILKFMHRHPCAEAYEQSLAVMGVDGTLARRPPAAPDAEARAKTGTLDYASALSGYLKTKTGEEIAFSFICNNFLTSVQTVHQVQDSICTLLAKER